LNWRLKQSSLFQPSTFKQFSERLKTKSLKKSFEGGYCDRHYEWFCSTSYQKQCIAHFVDSFYGFVPNYLVVFKPIHFGTFRWMLVHLKI